MNKLKIVGNAIISIDEEGWIIDCWVEPYSVPKGTITEIFYSSLIKCRGGEFR